MPSGNNLHRFVVFRDVKIGPARFFHSICTILWTPRTWTYMAAYEKKTGGQVLAIPHNGNLSNGLMFDDKTYSGKQLSKAYAETRSRYEPIVEVTQIKGDGEAHPLLSPTLSPVSKFWMQATSPVSYPKPKICCRKNMRERP
jgi:Protein of unknown function (DUF3604)